MSQWLADAPPIVSYLIGIIPLMVGAILLLGAVFLKPPKKTDSSTVLPTMRDHTGTIPPHYDAREQL